MLTFLRNKRLELVITVFAIVLLTPVVANAFALELGVLVMQIFARITGWAGLLLNLAIMELVFNMGTILTTDIGASVENSWALIRDLMNLLFIFSLIYIGFLVILDADSSIARRLLPPLIIAALLVNFSLFFTKFMVDVSNIAAVEIYQATIGNGLLESIAGDSTSASPGEVTEALVNIGISGAFMQSLGLKDLISPNHNDSANTRNVSYEVKLAEACGAGGDASGTGGGGRECSVDVLVYFFLSIIFFLIAAYAFAIGAFMLTWRFVVLIFLMIFSPFMFIGMIFPKAQRYQARWWQTFIFACLYAPAYFLMLYIAYTLASRVNLFDANDFMYDAVSGVYSAVDLILNFVLVIAFLLAATWVGREMSFYGSNATVRFAQNVGRRARRYAVRGGRYAGGTAAGGALGVGAYGLRQTAGRIGYNTANEENKAGKALTRLSAGTGLNAWLAKRALGVADRAGKASFDPRQALSKNAQKTLGTGRKGGIDKVVADRKKAEEARSKLYGQNDKQIYEDYGVAAENDYYKQREKMRDQFIADRAKTETAEERRQLTIQIGEINGQIKDMEKAGNSGKGAKRVAPTWFVDSFAGNTEQAQAQWDQMKVFAQAKKEEKGYGKRKYATSLKNGYANNVTWADATVGQRAMKVFGAFVDDPIAREAAAKEISKKNTNKSSGQQIEDIIKGEISDGGGDTTQNNTSGDGSGTAPSGGTTTSP